MKLKIIFICLIVVTGLCPSCYAKYQDDESDLTYYGYRYDNSVCGRWLSRDPIDEKGGANVYASMANDRVNKMDFLGLFIELWYGNHTVTPYIFHSKLWLITDDVHLLNQPRYHFNRAISKTEIVPDSFVGPCQMGALSIGAGPDKSRFDLTASFNRPRDVSKQLFHPTLVTTFPDFGQALRFLSRVDLQNRVMNWNFDNTMLMYSLLPGDSYTDATWNQFNSNSYVSGILGSFGFSKPQPGGIAPGYSKPVPNFVFKMVFSSDEALRQVWRQYYPGLL